MKTTMRKLQDCYEEADEMAKAFLNDEITEADVVNSCRTIGDKVSAIAVNLKYGKSYRFYRLVGDAVLNKITGLMLEMECRIK